MLEKYNLSFDLGCFDNQREDGADGAKNNPNISIILNHVGQPIKRDDEEFARWKNGIKIISENQNVNCKLSGVTMTDHNWTNESIKEIKGWVIMKSNRIFSNL